jgi:UDP-N-acetyl-D-mannosaminuronic acid dehydrogenase
LTRWTASSIPGAGALRAIRSQAREEALIVDPWNCFGAGQVFAYVAEVQTLAPSA